MPDYVNLRLSITEEDYKKLKELQIKLQEKTSFNKVSAASAIRFAISEALISCSK